MLAIDNTPTGSGGSAARAVASGRNSATAETIQRDRPRQRMSRLTEGTPWARTWHGFHRNMGDRLPACRQHAGIGFQPVARGDRLEAHPTTYTQEGPDEFCEIQSLAMIVHATETGRCRHSPRAATHLPGAVSAVASHRLCQQDKTCTYRGKEAMATTGATARDT